MIIDINFDRHTFVDDEIHKNIVTVICNKCGHKWNGKTLELARGNFSICNKLIRIRSFQTYTLLKSGK